MPIIAEHHKTWKDTEYAPTQPWLDDTYVQWGDSGLVINTTDSTKSYKTAFFEAFPAKPCLIGFLRGEGETLADAEKDCFEKYDRATHCDHQWGRKHYRNGGMLCYKCKQFTAKMVGPVVTLGEWKTPINKWDTHTLEWLAELNKTENDPRFGPVIEGIPQKGHYARQLYLRHKHFGVKEE
jgi:hypothetical protein